MPKPAKGARLGGSAAHERLMLSNLATSLFQHGRITTTKARAKRLRPFAERIITISRRGDLSSRRRVMTIIRDKTVVHELFTRIGPANVGRDGGYLRIIAVENRKGDDAPMAVVELVDPGAQEVVAEAEGVAKSAAKSADKSAAKSAPKSDKESKDSEGATTEG